ncbi:unnamed protein product [Phyllotreta striolata]|uniref:Cytochrome P450 n=1 Tax=Phyllotreta striolata TaxID=444603 RepID=A0A9N9TM01_PHYSR|nr:unnamed protein product [Phyllotreta striolata]
MAEWLRDYYNTVQEKFFGLYVFDEPFFVVKDPEIAKNGNSLPSKFYSNSLFSNNTVQEKFLGLYVFDEPFFIVKDPKIAKNFLLLQLFTRKFYSNSPFSNNTVQEKFLGLYVFDEPFFVVKDPEIAKNITIRDFQHFTDRQVSGPSHDVLQQNFLFFQKSDVWKSARTKVTPAFTAGKMKAMYHLIDASGRDLSRWLETNAGPVEAKELAAKYSTNVIAKCAFGIDPECFVRAKPMFREMGRRFFDFSWRNGFCQTLYFLKPRWVDRLKIDFVDGTSLKYFAGVFLDTLNSRVDDVKHNDFIDLLKELRKKEPFNDDQKLAGVAIQIFMAGFEPTASTIAFTMYEFSLNKEVQDKAREEVLGVLEKYNGEITYEAAKDCTYLDMCMKETIRKYPVLPFLDRACTENYKVPGTDVLIEKGTAVIIPMYGFQMDEQYFPDPYKYDPERFREKIDSDKGLIYMPFGEGPRICPGERFGLLTAKLAIMYTIRKFEIEKCERTPERVEFEPKSFLFQSKVGLYINFKTLN